ncbi:Steroid 17-alpha-hydroxylase/17,20 lyase [Colletotrichum siamense]|nr:Steroid 17-alpha-hydroxylase/17,20 lyase [Colletotrichum siamense]
MWLKLKEWADEFGPIYQTSMLGQKFVIISDEEMAQELLVKNGNNFAGRPQIRALIDHKLGPAYSALMDRHAN